MPCGLYGKLPAKRDFIALGVPGGFLRVWEPWLQSGLAASRLALGEAWTDAFLRAPIWRFWLGADIVAAPSIGALMPSVDGIGRYFPLTLVCQGEPGREPPAPERAFLDAWFESAEDFLVSALARDTSFERVTARLASLPGPEFLRPPPARGIIRSRGDALVVEGDGFAAAMERLRPFIASDLHAGMSYWWTVGGDEFPPRLAACRGLPEPSFHVGLLTGRFDDVSA